ncbi:MAG: LamG domain-containing protein, partial [Candidatus Aenigmarchaeota archaeon]|nr:LamG domain-containing protein [Candidatus Aenigmarchaeota archaeon]
HFTSIAGNFTVYKEDEDPKKRLPRYFDSIKGELTISFWIKLEEPSNKPIIETNNFKVEIENDEIKVGIWLETGWKYWDSGGTKLKRDAWTHVGIIYSNITGKGETFINGRIVGKLGEDIKSTFKPQEGAFTVGNFKGYMDELRIYNRALSSGEIVMHFQGLY